MKNKKILVTGGFGYVGSCLTPHLLAAGYSVRVIDLMLYSHAGLDAILQHPSYPNWKNHFEWTEADIRNPEDVAKAMQNVDAVIHLAAISNDPTGQIDEVLTRQVNFDAVGLLLTIARNKGVHRFINASSSSVFGIKHETDVTEALEPEPLTFYSKYKMLSEWIVTAAASPDLCTVNIRPATICGYSPRQRFDLTVNKLTADAVRKRMITVHGGEQRRPNIGMTDIVHLYTQLLQTDAAQINGRTFNFGFENHKVIEIARVIQGELKDLNVRIEITDTTDHRDYHISSAKMVKELGYKPQSSIRQEVQNLRVALEKGSFPNIDAPEYYNMQKMTLQRSSLPYSLPR